VRYVILVVVLLLIALGVFSACTFRYCDDDPEAISLAKAEQLQDYAKTYSSRNDKRVEDLSDLARYAEEGSRAIIDPWGKRFRFLYVIDPKSGEERLIIWTVNPKTGKILAAPHEAAEWIGP